MVPRTWIVEGVDPILMWGWLSSGEELVAGGELRYRGCSPVWTG